MLKVDMFGGKLNSFSAQQSAQMVYRFIGSFQ